MKNKLTATQEKYRALKVAEQKLNEKRFEELDFLVSNFCKKIDNVLR